MTGSCHFAVVQKDRGQAPCPHPEIWEGAWTPREAVEAGGDEAGAGWSVEGLCSRGGCHPWLVQGSSLPVTGHPPHRGPAQGVLGSARL